MIEEAYVSFEMAKLLKEKGFDVPCNCYGAYNGVNLTYRLCITGKYTNWNRHTDKFIISCPTLQMAMKWLRENYLLHISIDMMNGGRWEYEIDDISTPFDGGILPKYYCGKTFSSYEEAVNDAIKYCLENLI